MGHDISAGSSVFLLSEKPVAEISGSEGFSQVWNEVWEVNEVQELLSVGGISFQGVER